MTYRRVDLGSLPPDLASTAAFAAAVTSARLVCFPTDTVYGIGGSLRQETVTAIVAAKGREPDKPLQVIFPTLRLLLDQVALGPRLSGAVRRLLPGPLTLVVPYPPGWTCPPPGFAGGVPTLGLRVPRWPASARRLEQISGPLIASSANLAGEPPPLRLAGVDPAILAACDLVCDGGQVDGHPSSVVDLSQFETQGTWRLLRAGAWDEAHLAAELARVEPIGASGTEP